MTTLSETVIRNIRTIRKARKISAQELADEAIALGLDTSRGIIANLESGRRRSITIEEMEVFARVLMVEANLLLSPVAVRTGLIIEPVEST